MSLGAFLAVLWAFFLSAELLQNQVYFEHFTLIQRRKWLDISSTCLKFCLGLEMCKKRCKKTEKLKKSQIFEILNFQIKFSGVKSKNCIFFRGLKNFFFDVLSGKKTILAKIHVCPPDFLTFWFFRPLQESKKNLPRIFEKKIILDFYVSSDHSHQFSWV